MEVLQNRACDRLSNWLSGMTAGLGPATPATLQATFASRRHDHANRSPVPCLLMNSSLALHHLDTTGRSADHPR